MGEPFQGRFRLVERLPDCGELPRYRVAGVTLEGAVEGLHVVGLRRWAGLAELVWLRLARRAAGYASATHAPLAVEQDAESLLILHPPLSPRSWETMACELSPERLREEVAALLSWAGATARDGPARGNLRLSTLWKEGSTIAVAPAACALPPALIAARGRWRRWRRLLARAEEGEGALDLALLSHDLTRFLARIPWLRRARGGSPSASPADRKAREALLELRSALTAVVAAAQAGATVESLAGALETASRGLTARRRVAAARTGDGAGRTPPPDNSPDESPGEPAGSTAPGLEDLGGLPDGALLVVPAASCALEAARSALAARLPAQADLTSARGLAAEPLAVTAPGSGRQDAESWLILAGCDSQPPAAAGRWLARTRGRRRKIVLLASADSPSMVERLLRRDLELRWGFRAIDARPLAAVDTRAASPPREPASASVLAEHDARVVLALLAFSDLTVPLPLLAQATGVPARRLGGLLAAMAEQGWLTVETVQAGWLRTECTCAIRATEAGRAAAAARLDSRGRGAFLELLLHHLPSARRPDLLWIRFHLLTASEDRRAAAHALAALLAAATSSDEDYLAIGACAEALAPDLASSLPAVLRLRAGCRLGQACQARGLFDEALALFDAALAVHRSAGVSPASAEEAAAGAAVVVAMADLFDNRGDFAAARSLLRETLTAYDSVLTPAVRGKVQFELAWAHFRLGQFDAALEICHALLKQLDAQENPAETADVYNLIGVVRYNSSRYEEARVNLQKGLVLRERVNDLGAVARSCNNLGLVHMALGNLTRADAFLQRSLTIKNAAGDVPGVASCLINLACIALAQQQLDLARERGEKALSIARAYGLRQHTAEGLHVLGEVSEEQERFDEASERYAEAHALSLEIGAEDQRLSALRRQAALMLRGGDAGGARLRYAEAEALLARVPSRLQRALLSELEGDLLSAEGHAADAARAYEAAADGLTDLHKPELVARAHSRAALAWQRAGEPARARALFDAVRVRGLDPRLAKLPPEFAELDRIFGSERDPARGGGSGSEAILRCLAALAELETHRLGFAAFARRIVDLLHATGAFAQLGFALVTPTGETAGRWEAPTAPDGAPPPAELASIPATAPIRVRHQWPDGTTVLGEASLAVAPGAIEGDARAAERREIATGALTLVAGVINSYRVRAAEERRGHAAAPDATPAGALAGGPMTSVPLVGISGALAELRRVIDKVADRDAHVLIQGESGSGKEVVARLIHVRSRRRDEEFVAVNCASIPAALLESTLFGHERGSFTDAVSRRIGEFERAGRGTILLDEIGEMPLQLQPKLLRVLQEGEFHRVGGVVPIRLRARVLAATNVDIEKAVAEGRFRSDLYFRLAVISARVPPLRERPEDIPVLMRYFLETCAAEYSVPVCQVSDEAMSALSAAPWPGNVRELENLVKRLLIFAEGRTIRLSDLPASVAERSGPAAGVTERLEDLVARYVRAADFDPGDPLLPRLLESLARQLVARFDNKSQVARVLGISTPTLYEWLRQAEKREQGGRLSRREGAAS